MASPPKPWKLEYAKSSRSTCKTCKNTIDKDSFRIAKMIPATQFDGFMPVWHHASCIMKKKGQFRNIEDVEGIDNLRWEDQQKIRKYILEAGESATPEGDGENDECAIEYAKSGRATCKGCGEKIAKGEIRISTMVESDNPRFRSKVPVWRHAKCFLPLSIWRSQMESMPGWDNLSEEDKEIVRGLAKPYVKEVKKDGDSGKGESRKRKSKDDETLVNEKAKKQNSEGKSNISDKNDLDKVLESQSKALWKIKDELQKNVSTSEMREMLEVNDQISSGSEYNLKERCADGMLFGPLGKCPKCSGLLEYSDSQYKCQGYLTAWSKCTYATTSPERLKGKWKIPEDTENEYLKKWFKTQKVKKPSRVFPVQASAKSAGNDSAMGSTDSTFLSGLKVVLAGKLKRSPPDWTSQLEAAGGNMLKNLTRGIDCLIVSESDDESNNADVEKALNMKIPVVRESYILDCLEKKKRLSVRRYQTEEASKAEVVKVKVKGRSSVHEESGLQETGHILEDGKSIYNTTLNMSDLSTSINSYYILQITEDDKKAVYHVFRKWGRVGNSRIGGQKLERMPKSEAKAHFE